MKDTGNCGGFSNTCALVTGSQLASVVGSKNHGHPDVLAFLKAGDAYGMVVDLEISEV